MHKLFSLIFVLLGNLVWSQQYNPHILHFTQKDYGDSCHLQNVSVCQGKNGLMYFGNNLRVLEYDGENWNAIRTPVKGGFVSALTAANDSVVYVGANNEFGYLGQDKQGTTSYFSLSDKFAKDKTFGRIWRIVAYKDKIAFVSESCIFIYSQGKITKLFPKNSFHLAFAVEDELYVRQRKIGLMKLQKDSLVLVPNGEIFRTYGVFEILPASNGHYLIITQEKGLFNFFPHKAENNIVQLKTGQDELLVQSKIYGACLLNDNKIALNTELNGLIIIDSLGQINYHFNTKTDLPDNGIRGVCQDNYQNIWLVTNLGIAKINYASPISFYNAKNALQGIVKDLAFFNDKIFVASSTGLYYHTINDSINSVRFDKIGGYTGEINQLLSTEGNLLAVTNSGLYKLAGYNLERVDSLNISTVCYSKKTKQFFAIGASGFAIFDNQLKRVRLFPEYPLDDAIEIVEELRNDSLARIWAGSMHDGLHLYEINDKLELTYDYYTSLDSIGLDEAWVIPFVVDGKVVFSQASGIKAWEGDNGQQKFGLIEPFGVKNAAITQLFDSPNTVWLCVDGKVAYFNKLQKKFHWQAFNTLNLGIVNAVVNKNDKVWVCGDNQLISVDFSKKKNYQVKPQVLIRRINIENNPQINLGGLQKNKLDHRQNSIVFQFASLFEENSHKAKYSFLLENYDAGWSDWQNIDQASYKKLPAGNYKFSVKAIDIYGNESETVSVRFDILPAWYNTLLAYIVYLLLAMVLVWGIVSLYTSKLKRDKLKLEIIVENRTAELTEQKKEIEHIHREQTHSIEYAKRIQHSVLPDKKLFESTFKEHFVFFKPKDIVSGDFYWIEQLGDKIIVCVADCTGHGVPGAFMSMLGISFLEEIVEKEKQTDPAEILNRLRTNIINALKQKGADSEQKDGMDIALLSIDTKTKTMEYAGAFNSVYIISDEKAKERFKVEEKCRTEYNGNVLYEIKADRMPISIYGIMNPFKNQSFQLEKDDSIYLFSDGYSDQFGGTVGEKYKYGSFKSFLLKIAAHPMERQAKLLEEEFVTWKGNYSQLDDVTVLGVRV